MAELQAFENVKRAAAKSIALSPLTVDSPLYFASDASKFALSSCIWQRDEKTNKPRYLAAVSRLFDKWEILWSIFRKEVSAIITMLSLHNWMFRGAPRITAYCDSKAVGFLRGSKNRTPILFRFSQTISCYNLEIIHVAGKDNYICDHISRSIFPEDQPTEEELIPMSELTSNELFNQLMIPRGIRLDVITVRKYMLDDGWWITRS